MVIYSLPRAIAASGLLFVIALFGVSVQADVVVTTSGANTFTSNEFFRFEAVCLPDGVSVTGMSIDLQGGTDPNDIWDVDQNGGNSPWGFRNGFGITSADVTFDQAPGAPPPNSSIMDITFAPGTMTTGDWFTFDFDTDATITDGDEFGQYGVTVQLRLSNGSIFDTAFVNDGVANLTSTATFEFAAVPEPGHALVLTSIGCIALLVRRRR